MAEPQVLEGGWRVVEDSDEKPKDERLIEGGWRVVEEAPPSLPVRAFRAVKGVLAPSQPAETPDGLEGEFERIAGTTRLVPPVAGQREMARREPGGAPDLFRQQPMAPPTVKFGRLQEVPEPILPGVPTPEVSGAVRAAVTEAVREAASPVAEAERAGRVPTREAAGLPRAYPGEREGLKPEFLEAGGERRVSVPTLAERLREKARLIPSAEAQAERRARAETARMGIEVPTTPAKRAFEAVSQVPIRFVQEYTLGLIPAMMEASGLRPPADPTTPEGQLAGAFGQLAGFIYGPARMAHGIFRGFLEPVATDAVRGVVAKTIAKSAVDLSLATGLAATGQVLRAPSVREALGIEAEALKGGAVLGVLFGGMGTAVSGAGLAATAGRMGLGMALIDAAHGEIPFAPAAQALAGNRELLQTAFDYGINAYFLLRGRDPRRVLAYLQAEASRRGQTPDDLFREIVAEAQKGDREIEAEFLRTLAPTQYEVALRRAGTDQGEAFRRATGEGLDQLLSAAEAGLSRRGIEPPAPPTRLPEPRPAVPEVRPGLPAGPLRTAREIAGGPPEAPVQPAEARRAAQEAMARAIPQAEAAERLRAYLDVPSTFREFVEAQGRRWPLGPDEPGYLALRQRWDELRQPLYTTRGPRLGKWEVVNRVTGQVEAQATSPALAQLEANRLDQARMRPLPLREFRPAGAPVPAVPEARVPEPAPPPPAEPPVRPTVPPVVPSARPEVEPAAPLLDRPMGSDQIRLFVRTGSQEEIRTHAQFLEQAIAREQAARRARGESDELPDRYWATSDLAFLKRGRPEVFEPSLAARPEPEIMPRVAVSPPVAPLPPERPAFREARRPAPATFAFYQEIRGREPLAQYHLTEDIPRHPKDSTVSPETLREAGYEVPETPTFEAWQRGRGVGQALFQPTTYARRPDATPETDRQGQLALFNLEEAARRPLSSETGNLAGREPTPRARTLGVGFTAEAIHKDLLETGTVNLRGRSVVTGEDLAVLGQVVRDPRFETFRIYPVKGNIIVGQEALTSRMPGYASAFLTEDMPGELNAMRERMQKLGADGYWLMHNHPSGNARMSEADVNLTEMFAREVPGFRGHVVIDSGEYGVMLPGQDPIVTRLPEAGRDLLLTPKVPHRMLGMEVTTPEAIARIGSQIKAPRGWAVLLYRSGTKSRAIQELPVADLRDRIADAAWIKRQTQVFGATDAMLYSAEPNPLLRTMARELIRDRAILDYVAPTKRGGFTGTATFEEIQRAQRIPGIPARSTVRVEARREEYGIDPALRRELAQAGRELRRTHPDYEGWARAMRQEFGERAAPHLERTWEDIRRPAQPAEPEPAEPEPRRVREFVTRPVREATVALDQAIPPAIERIRKRATKFATDLKQVRDRLIPEAQVIEREAEIIGETGTLAPETRKPFREEIAPKPETFTKRVSEQDIADTQAAITALAREYRDLRREVEQRADPFSQHTARAVQDLLGQATGGLNALAKEFRAQRFAAGRSVKRFDRPVPEDVLAALQEAGVMTEWLGRAKPRLPIYTNILRSLRQFPGLTQPERRQFVRDLVDAWRLNLFSVTSWSLDFVGNASEIGMQVAGGTGRDLVQVLRGSPNFPSLQALFRAVKDRALHAGVPLPEKLEAGLGATIGGERIGGGFRGAISGAQPGTFTTRKGIPSRALDLLVGSPLYAKGVFDTGAKRLMATATVWRDAIEEANRQGLSGQDRRAFYREFLRNIPEATEQRAIEAGNKAGFNRQLSDFEEQIAASTLVRLFGDVFARWPFQFTRTMGEWLGYNPTLFRDVVMGKASAEDVASWLVKTATGWGALYLLNETLYDRVDFNSMEYIHEDGNRTRLSNRDPLPTALWLLATIKGDMARSTGALKYASVPGARVLGGEGVYGGGLLGGVYSAFVRATKNADVDARALQRELTDTVNRLIPGQAVLGSIESLFDPVIQEGIGANIPGVSSFLEPAIKRTTGEPLEPRQEVLGVEIPTIAGTPIPGAKRLLDPVERLLSRYGLVIYRGPRSPIAGLPPVEVPREILREWLVAFAENRQRFLGPLADQMDRGDFDDQNPDGIRERILAKDTLAATLATNEINRRYGTRKKLPRQPTIRERRGPVEFEQERQRFQPEEVTR